jgi:FKBP-type peptidyl-prolyl cis-trans isomerase FkpA
VQQLAMGRANKRAETEKAGAKDFLDKAAKEEGAQKLPSGLVFKTVKPGTGPNPTADDRVKVHYHGTLTNGTVFDSSVKRNEPAEFPLRGVIPCWTEGVAKMKVGEKAKLVCPSEIAYGDEGRPPVIPGGATLIFDVELLEITSKGAAPKLSLPAGLGGKIELSKPVSGGEPPKDAPKGAPKDAPKDAAKDAPKGEPAKK